MIGNCFEVQPPRTQEFPTIGYQYAFKSRKGQPERATSLPILGQKETVCQLGARFRFGFEGIVVIRVSGSKAPVYIKFDFVEPLLPLSQALN